MKKHGENHYNTYEMNDNLPECIKNDDAYYQFIDYARFPIIIPKNMEYSFINLIYSPFSYRLIFTVSDNNTVISRKISGFDLLENKE